ncbi:hypothetical protein GCM10011297_17900 [Bacterioplanes sanyensis]|uniref:hypothetical protein n=1 Tax=Bacterioplanes sanyensis TaxID=1249553 RepID=UPI0016763292|nr:hypothetical protein [Bacterioplanes sanyensis]GGY45311.1 hypothetical protein GCM10011297_17900 [Bacterioplanes sanyensis]
MTILLSLIVVSIIIALLLALMLVDRGRRNTHLQQVADQLGLRYRPYASLSQPVREARFRLIECGQFRHFRYLLEGSFRQRPVNIFDYSLVNQQGTATQTVILLHCPLAVADWRLQLWQQGWLHTDPLTDPELQPLQTLSAHQKPPALRDWHLASNQPGRLHQGIDALADWCLAHPHLHIEYAAGMLMLYRPRHELDAEQLEQALIAADDLCQRLQSIT